MQRIELKATLRSKRTFIITPHLHMWKKLFDNFCLKFDFSNLNLNTWTMKNCVRENIPLMQLHVFYNECAIKLHLFHKNLIHI